MHPVKNIFLDFGGVILNIDFNKTQSAFEQLGVKDFNNFYSQSHASPVFELLETGKITAEEFYERFRNIVNLSLTNEQIKNSWNSLLINFIPESLQWIEINSKKFDLYLISNTNEIHYQAFMKMYNKQTGKTDFNKLFKKAYYSHELGLRKPHKEIYETILKNENLKKEETILIDDTLKNIEGAIAVGWHAIHLTPPIKLCDVSFGDSSGITN